MLAFDSLQLSPLAVSLVISFFIPVITGLATKYGTSSALKGFITLTLNAVQALLVTAYVAADGTKVVSKASLVTFLVSFVVSVGSYVGLLKPALITSSHPDGKLAPETGI